MTPMLIPPAECLYRYRAAERQQALAKARKLMDRATTLERGGMFARAARLRQKAHEVLLAAGIHSPNTWHGQE